MACSAGALSSGVAVGSTDGVAADRDADLLADPETEKGCEYDGVAAVPDADAETVAELGGESELEALRVCTLRERVADTVGGCDRVGVLVATERVRVADRVPGAVAVAVGVRRDADSVAVLDALRVTVEVAVGLPE